MRCVNENEMAALARRLYEQGLMGDVRASDLVFNRTMGAPVQVDYAARIARIEAALGLDVDDDEAEPEPAASSNGNGNGHHPPSPPEPKRGPF